MIPATGGLWLPDSKKDRDQSIYCSGYLACDARLSLEILLAKGHSPPGNLGLLALFKAIGSARVTVEGSRERLRSGSGDRERLRALRALVHPNPGTRYLTS
jgi:hypothetical protein